MTDARYLTCPHTAKLIRAALKRAFPRVKFSVRSSTYAGGASICVAWTDGPTVPTVRTITSPYAGADFDGMIDMKFSVTTWLLPDGSATHAHSPGTGDQHGSISGYDHAKPHPNAELIHTGADYVFCNRSYSVPYERVGRNLCALQHIDFTDLNMPMLCGLMDSQHLHDHVLHLLRRTSFAPGEVYAGVRYTADDPSTSAWCKVITILEA